ncbi:MAG: PAS domain S-box protein, partial [Bacteroidota bacterium]
PGIWDGKPVIFGVTKDISKIKLSEEKFSKVFYLNPSVCGLSDLDTGEYVEVNDQFYSLLGFEKNEVIGKTASDLGILTIEANNAVMSKAERNGNVTNIEADLKAKNGDIKHVLLSAENIYVQDKKYRFTVVHDITELKQAEDALLASVEKFRLEFDTSPNSITISRIADGVLVSVNKGFLQMSGYTHKEAIGKVSSEIRSWIDPEECRKFVEEIQSRGEVRNYEAHLQTRSGEIYGLMSASKIDLNGEPHVLTITSDITELKQAEQELIIAKEHAEQSDRLKSAFLANMSHEIRTPMNGILGFADLLKEPGLTGEEQQEYIRIIEKGGARMLNIINDIVSISKIESGVMEVKIEESNINEQIEYIYTFFKPEVEGKGMRLFFKNTLPTIEAIINTDREKLYAILTNLVKNAIQYTDKGTIEFGYNLRRDKASGRDKACLVSTPVIEFYVKDTGIGIPKDRQEAIFERFIQGDTADRMARQGAGLGLSITKSYIEMLGGEIWVESDPEGKSGGKGSIFYFTLPYNYKPREENVITNVVLVYNTDNLINSDISALKILVVEDDDISERLISIALKTISFEVLKVKTGVEAIEACRNNPDIDLVLMDILLPVMNGYKATRQIRQFNKDVVIIAQTAYGLSGDREKAIEAGCNDYMTKPINKNELLTLIQKYFKK